MGERQGEVFECQSWISVDIQRGQRRDQRIEKCMRLLWADCDAYALGLPPGCAGRAQRMRAVGRQYDIAPPADPLVERGAGGAVVSAERRGAAHALVGGGGDERNEAFEQLLP